MSAVAEKLIDDMDSEPNELNDEEKMLYKSSHNDAPPWYHIDRTMISSKLCYFFQNGKDACYLPYMILFLKGIGLNSQQAGTINGLRYIVNVGNS